MKQYKVLNVEEGRFFFGFRSMLETWSKEELEDLVIRLNDTFGYCKYELVEIEEK